MKILATFGILILLFSSIFLLSAKNDDELLLGYCPTMGNLAKEIAIQNDGVILVQKESSSDALLSLNNNEVDVILIGRLAKVSEFSIGSEKQIGVGYTLVSDTKKFIEKDDLNSIVVHTSLSESEISFLNLTNVVYYEDILDAFEQGKNSAVLIDWNDFKDEYELVVVMNNGVKEINFRLPVLYSKSIDLDELKI